MADGVEEGSHPTTPQKSSQNKKVKKIKFFVSYQCESKFKKILIDYKFFARKLNKFLKSRSYEILKIVIMKYSSTARKKKYEIFE